MFRSFLFVILWLVGVLILRWQAPLGVDIYWQGSGFLIALIALFQLNKRQSLPIWTIFVVAIIGRLLFLKLSSFR